MWNLVETVNKWIFLDDTSILFQLCMLLWTLVVTILLVVVCPLNSRRNQRHELEKQLKKAQNTVKDLEEKLLSLEVNSNLNNANDGARQGKEIRIWMDGAFDMMHFGHMNAFRQGRALGTKLIVGVNSDESITACKGQPVNTVGERIATVRGCKWVDEVVPDVPYVMNEEYLMHIIEKYRIDYVVHGDDPCLVDGKDVYETARKLGKYLTIPRTEGISTTDIVGRMLLMTRSHHSIDESKSDLSVGVPMSLCTLSGAGMSKFLTTSRTIRQFGSGVTAPKKDHRIVYLAGAWDMFHAGHVSILERAKSLGDYVIVGVHNDEVVNKIRGSNLPIMNLHERVLSVLGCKWVDDVLIDAPYVINKEIIDIMRISVVVHGIDRSQPPTDSLPARVDPYALPQEMGILQTLEVTKNISVLDIIQRIHNQREKFSVKFTAKSEQERKYYSSKYDHHAL